MTGNHLPKNGIKFLKKKEIKIKGIIVNTKIIILNQFRFLVLIDGVLVFVFLN